jgi:hypothetical protein
LWAKSPKRRGLGQHGGEMTAEETRRCVGEMVRQLV